MKKPEILENLKKWQTRMIAMNNQLEKLAGIFAAGADNSPLVKEIALMQEEYTFAVQDSIGDEYDTMLYWWMSCGFTESKMTVLIGDNEFPMRNIEDVASAIESMKRQ